MELQHDKEQQNIERATADRDHRFNMTVMSAGEMSWGMYMALIAPSTVLTVLLRAFGAGSNVGIISAIEGGAVLVPQLLGAYLFHGLLPRKKLLMPWHLLATIPFLLLSAIAIYWSLSLPYLWVRVILLVSFATIQAMLAIIVPLWTDWMGHLFETQRRGNILGILLAFSAIIAVAGSWLAGYLIDIDPRPIGYVRHFLLAALCVVISMAAYYQVREPKELVEASRAAKGEARAPRRELLQHMDASIRNRNTQAFIVGRILTVCGFSILPFIAVHYTTAAGGSLDSGFVVKCGAAQAVAAAFSTLVLGRVGDRRGHRLGLIVGAFVQLMTLGILLFSSGTLSCIFTYMGIGAAVGSTSLAHVNLLLETCPHENRVAHVTVGNISLGAAAIAAPLLSNVVVQAWGTSALFAGCAAFSLAGVIWLIWRMEEPRQLEPLYAEQASAR